MPEGDTVWRAARHLHQALAGAEIESSDFRVPQLATASLDGATVTEVIARGKHILLRTDDSRTLHSHLRMDGSWHLYKSKARIDHEVRVILRTDTWSAIGYRLHDLALVSTSQESELVGHLGPDLLGPDWDEDLALANLAADSREIADALLDQRNLAGIGNLYKSEVLFLHGVSPFSRAVEARQIVRTARKLLLANREHPQQSTTGNLKSGQTHWVYGRAGKPCRRCGTRIQSRGQGEHARITYWCPTCQE